MEQNYQINSKKLTAIDMKKLIKCSIIFALGIALITCDNDKFPGQISVKENVSFKLDIQPILTQECATCHNPSETNPDLREGYTSRWKILQRIVSIAFTQIGIYF